MFFGIARTMARTLYVSISKIRKKLPKLPFKFTSPAHFVGNFELRTLGIQLSFENWSYVSILVAQTLLSHCAHPGAHFVCFHFKIEQKIPKNALKKIHLNWFVCFPERYHRMKTWKKYVIHRILVFEGKFVLLIAI